MFKRVLQILFPSMSSTQQPAIFAPTSPQGNSAEPQPSTTQQATLKADRPLNPHDAEFLDYLFGESQLRTETDPFSDFVATQIERLLRSPKALLHELPVMPASMTTLMSELQSDDFNVEALLEVIEREPSMAADMIKLANSAFYKRGEKQVTDLKTAFMNMGSQGLIEGVINTYLKNFTPTNSIYWRQFGEKIWQHSIQTACLSKDLIKETPAKDDQATAYFIGLIRNLGKMIIFQAMVEAFKHVDPTIPPNSTALKRLINSYSIRLTYTIAKFWELPEEVLMAIAYQESRKYQSTPLAQSILEANYICELQCLLQAEMIDIETFQKRSEFHLRSEGANKVAQRILSEAMLNERPLQMI